MNRLLVAVSVILVWAIAGPVLAADPLLLSVDEAMQEPLRMVKEWENDRIVALGLVLAVIVLGAVIAIIHAVPTNAEKIGAVVLGASVTLLTGVSNAYLDFDHRQYKAMASQGRQTLADIRIQRNQLEAIPIDDKAAREAIFEEIRKQANSILGLPDRQRVTQAPATPRTARLTDMLISAAQAQQSPAPDWITKLPEDDTNLYFLGSAEGRDYLAAVKASEQNAHDEARSYLAGRLHAPQTSQSVDGASAAKYLLDSAQVASRYSRYDRSAHTFRCYTLVSLSRKVAESDLRLFGAKTSQIVAPVQQLSLKSAVRTQSEYILKLVK